MNNKFYNLMPHVQSSQRTDKRSVASYFSKSISCFSVNRYYAILLATMLLLLVAQAWGQTITNVAVTGTPVCPGSQVNVSFLVTNGTNGNRFTASTNYFVFLNSTQLTVFTSGTFPANSTGATATISRAITIPASTASGTGYTISIRSTTPTYNVTNSTNPSSAFTIGSVVSLTSTNTAICSGASTTLSGNVTAYGNWTITLSTGETVSGSGSGAWSKLVTPLGTTTYAISSFTTSGCAQTASTSGSSTITVNSLTNIIAHPSSSPQNYCQGDVATALFISTNVTATSYEWYSNTNPSNTGGTLVPLATTNSYLPPTTTACVLYYYCKVLAPCGNQTSNASGAITVNSSPSITTQPSVSIPLICSINDPAPSLTVSASAGSGNITQYQWYSNAMASNSGGTLVQTNVTPATTDTYMPSTSSSGTLYYYCVVTNSDGCTVSSSISGAVTVTLSIITQPVASQTVVSGAPASFSVVAPPSSTYQWSKNGSPIQDATSSTYTIASVGVGDAATYTVIITNSICTPPVSSNSSELIVVVAQPTVQASAVQFSSVLLNSLTLNWTNGNGARRVIVARAGAAVNHDPVDGIDYTASTVFGSGSETAIGTGNYVVYNNNGSGPIVLTGLLPSTNYYFKVYEYNGTGSSSNYYVADATKNPNNQSTRPSTQSSGITFSNVSFNSMTVNWTGGDGANRIVVARAGGTATIPTDGVIYTANASYGSGSSLGTGKVVFNGSGNAVTITSLNQLTNYSFDIYEYAGSQTSTTDKTVYLTPGVTNSQATSATPSNAREIVFTSITGSGMILNWTNGNGTNRIVVGHAGAPVNADPVTGTTVYAANATLGAGTQIGTGNYVIYKGTSNTVTVNGLSPSVTYYFKVYEYTTSGSTNTYNYTNTTNNPNNQSTKPSLQATLAAIPFPADSATSLQLDWINGNGTRRLVVVHEEASVDSNPVDGTIYTANTLFTAGSQIGTGNYVVYNGTGSSVTVTGLKDGTAYYFKIFEYAGSNASPSTTDLAVYLTGGSDIVHSTPARFSFRTQNSGVWTDLSTWQTYDVKTGSWPSATKLPNRNSSITIAAGNVITINSAVTTDQLTIDGTLTISNTGSLAIDANTRQSYNQSIGSAGTLNVYGTFSFANKAVSIGHSVVNTHFYSGSAYIHQYKQTEGIIPLATWDPGSTLTINGFTSAITASAAGNWGQSFSNVTFNCALTGGNSVDLNGLLTSIAGNLSVTNSGSGQILLNGGASSPAITVTGDITLSGSSTLCLNTIGSSVISVGSAGTGNVSVAGNSRLVANTTGSPVLNIPNNLLITSTNATGSSFNTSGNAIINIDGSLSMSGAGGLLSFGSGVAAGSTTVNIKKDFLFTSGIVSNASTNTSNFGQINFIGGGTHTFSNPGTMSGKIHITVSSSNLLDVGTSAIMGSGNFTLLSNVTLRVASTDVNGALQLAGSGGNLQNTGTRTFGSPSTIEFYGTGAQVIGDGFPSSASVNLINNNVFGLSAPAATLTLSGDFTNNGGFNHNNGTVVFTGGSSIKEVKGSSKVTFNNITINPGTANPDVRLENTAGAEIKGILNLSTDVASTFDADGVSNNRVLTLLSTGDSPTVDASVAEMSTSGGQVEGNITVQRFMSKEGGVNNNTRIYRYISSAVQNATVSDIQKEIYITGTFTGASTCSGCVSSSQSMFRYVESVSGNLNNGYVDFPVSTNTEMLVPGVGYAMFVRGDILPSAKWDIRGPLNSGTVSLPVTSSGITADDGWNLVANPFASTIDWNASNGWTKTNLNDAIYLTDNGSGTTATYIGGVGVNGGSNFIASGQAFWVKADSPGPILTIDERAKSAGTQTTFIRSAAPEDLLRITLTNGRVNDETVIYFKNNSTQDFDRSADALKFKNSSFNISSIIRSGAKLSINSMPRFDCDYEIKLAVEDVLAGNYKLNFSQFESFPEEISIVVKDNFTKTEFDIRKVISYAFSVTADTKSYGSERFSVAFSVLTINAEVDASAIDVCLGSDAELIISNTSTGMLYETLLSDSSVLNSAYGNGSVLALTIPRENLIAGQNTYTILATSSYCSLLTSEKAITFTVHQLPSAPVAENGKVCREGVITLKATGSSTGNYNWYESESDQVAIVDQHSSAFVTPFLVKSKTYYVSNINLLGCEGPRTSVQAEVVQYVDATITTQPKELTSNYTSGNQWYFNGDVILGAVNQSIKPTRPGVYKVEVMVNGCSTTDEIYSSSAMTTYHDEEFEVSTFPNPMDSWLNVTLSNPQNFAVVITMTDMDGKPLNVEVTESSDGVYILNTEYLPSGLYLLSVRYGSIAKTVKVLKE